MPRPVAEAHPSIGSKDGAFLLLYALSWVAPRPALYTRCQATACRAKPQMSGEDEILVAGQSYLAVRLI